MDSLKKYLKFLSGFRGKLLEMIIENEEITPVEICEELDINQSNVYGELRRMWEAGLIEKRKESAKTFYKLNKSEYLRVVNIINEAENKLNINK